MKRRGCRRLLVLLDLLLVILEDIVTHAFPDELGCSRGQGALNFVAAEDGYDSLWGNFGLHFRHHFMTPEGSAVLSL